VRLHSALAYESPVAFENKQAHGKGAEWMQARSEIRTQADGAARWASKFKCPMPPL
jgi:hypothetical protein